MNLLKKSCGGLAATLIALTLAYNTSVNGADASASSSIREIEGVYKKGQDMEFVDPAVKLEVVEDIVEIVRYDPTHIYFRAKLNFYNGHSCGIHGIAGYETESFVYHSADAPLSPCTLAISTTKAHLVLTDRLDPNGEATCSSYCGARGSLSDYRIERTRKRPIRYMNVLKQSREYLSAVDQFLRGRVLRRGD